jgi:hypothetical protein
MFRSQNPTLNAGIIVNTNNFLIVGVGTTSFPGTCNANNQWEASIQRKEYNSLFKCLDGESSTSREYNSMSIDTKHRIIIDSPINLLISIVNNLLMQQ